MADDWDQFPDADAWDQFPDAPPADPIGTETGMTRAAASGVSAFNRGVANVAGAPVDLVNAGLGAIGLPTSERPVAGSEFFKSMLSTKVPEAIPGVGGRSMVREPDPEYPGVERVGEMTGEGFGAITGLGLLSKVKTGVGVLDALAAPAGQVLKSGKAFLAQVPGEVASSLGSIFVGDKGEDVGREYGGETGAKIGKGVGETLGAMAPAGPAAALSSVTRKAAQKTGEVTSEQVNSALRRSGIEPSGGLVGNRAVARAENTATYLPAGGGAVRERQGRQVQQFGESLQDTARRRRGDQEPAGALDKSDVGVRLQDMATEGHDTIKHNVGVREAGLSHKARSSGTSVRVDDVKSRVHELMKTTTPEKQALLKGKLDDLDTMRTAPIDKQLDTRLRQREKVLQRSLKSKNRQAAKRMTPQLKSDIDAMTKQLDKIQADIDKNLGVSYEQFRDWRTEVGTATEKAGIAGGKMKRVYEAGTRSLEDFADRAGMRDDFDALMADEERVYRRRGNLDEGGDLPALKKEMDRRDASGAFNYLVEGGKQAPERLELIRRNSTPERWAEVSGDILELMGRANPGQVSTGSEFSPNTFLTNWSKMSDRTKDLLAGDERQALEDLAVAAKAFRERQQSGNASGTLSTGMTAGTALAMWLDPLNTSLALGAGSVVGRGLSSQGFARYLAEKAPKLSQRLGVRLTGQAGRELQE